MNYTIDIFEDRGNHYFLQGWGFDNEGDALQIKANSKYEVKRIFRYDVSAVFTDIQVNEQCGFELIVYKKMFHRFKKIKAVLYSNDESVEILLPIINEEDILDTPNDIEIIHQPKISIVIPVYNTPRQYFKELFDSILKQSYENWELCLADGGSDAEFIDYLRTFESDKVKIKYLDKNLGIAGNTNEAIYLATGDYIAFCDHDDCLTADALLEIVKVINMDDFPDFIYSDEDKMSMDSSSYFQPNHKSDFNIRLLEVGNYLNHISVIKKDFLYNIGLLNTVFDGSQDYDLVLRVAENTNKISHIKKILYHWRCHENSVADNPASKSYAFDNAIKALRAHFDRIGEDVEITKSEMIGSYKIVRK